MIKFNQEDFIQNYNKLKSSRKMSELYGCSKTTILNYAKKINYDIKSNKKYKLTEDQKKEIISLYNKSSSNQLAKKYNVSRGIITKLWYDNNLCNKKNEKIVTTEKNILGKKFSEWTVLYKTDKRNSAGNIYWHCKCSCGIEKDVTGNSLRNGTSISCGHVLSKGNFKIAQILKENNIPFEQEKKFDTCKDKKSLPFDFYVNNSYLIEFDGEQHYKDNKNHWNIYNRYEYTKKHDEIKNQWCKSNNIPLIRIPYWILEKMTIKDLKLETSAYII